MYRPRKTLSASVLMLMTTFCFLVSAAETLVIPHLPKDTQNFKVTVVFENLLDQDRHLLLEAHSITGENLGIFETTLKPLSRVLQTPGALFSRDDVSYFFIRGGVNQTDSGATVDTLTGIVAGVEYSYTYLPNSRAFVEAIATPSQRWRLYTGDWGKVFDGIVVVNLENCNTEISITHFDQEGQALQVVDLASIEDSFSKGVYNLNTMFEARPGSYMDISSRTNIAVTALRGTHNNERDESGFLIGNTAMAQPSYEFERRQLEENREKWLKADISAYVYNFQNACFCVPEVAKEVNLRVNSDWIQSVTYNDDNSPADTAYYGAFRTVSQLFDLIESSFASAPYLIQVDYDAEFGYPTRIMIDRAACIADEEIFITASDLQPIKE